MTGGFSYGDRLRQLRRERGLSQEQVALQADITTSYYGLLERGQANPSVALLEKICDVLNVRIADIFTDSNTNLLGIDAISMQILHQIHGKNRAEKEIVLNIVKNAIKLQDLKNSSIAEDN